MQAVALFDRRLRFRMNNASPLSSPDVFHVLRTHCERWLIPTLLAGAAATIYALVFPGMWESTQALIVRNEASNNQEGPGRFSRTDDMKVLQETILELSKSPAVLHEALAEVGPDADADRATWPNATDVDTARTNVKLVPPKGAEFGRTEIFYLKVRDRDRKRAVGADGRHLPADRAPPARAAQHPRRKHDRRAGQDGQPGQGRHGRGHVEGGRHREEGRQQPPRAAAAERVGLGRKRPAADAHRRGSGAAAGRHAVHTDEELLKLLKSGGSISGELMAMPSRLLESQPALRQLKDALIQAEIQRAQMQGKMGTGHPVVGPPSNPKTTSARACTTSWRWPSAASTSTCWSIATARRCSRSSSTT